MTTPPGIQRTIAMTLAAALVGLAGVVTFTSPASAAVVDRVVGTEPGLIYHNYAAPAGFADSAGEPSIGWTGPDQDAVMFQARLETSEIHWDDDYSTPVAQWASRPSLITSNTQTFDPILATDTVLGRTFVSQLALACSGASFSDDAGETWSPSTGCPAPHGVDHQTVGYGPAVPGSPEEIVAPQGRMAYYCSQELVTALCGASVDGGQTFGPSSPAFTAANCSNSFHGHVKVGPDGTVYLPSERCGGQAIARSLDNGRTFTFIKLPTDFTAVSNLTHPSISVSRAEPKGAPASTGPGVLYYANGDNAGRMVVSTTGDRGATWSPRVDIAAGLGLKAVDFPVVQAGDPDRAAVAFFGTKDKVGPGVYNNVGYGDVTTDGVKTNVVEWHLYVAHTYDRGVTWTTTDLTPTDPVQRGCLWVNGTTVNTAESACRNLLDFNGIAVDGIGRVLIGWADGCTGACRTSNLVADNARTQLGTISRLTKGRGLYAIDDGSITSGTLNDVGVDPCASGPQLRDDSGDAISIVGTETPLPSEPQLDVVSLLLSSEPNSTVKFTLTVEDLKSAAEVPSGSPGGVYYDLNFTYGGQPFYIAATRDALNASTFNLGAIAGTRQTLAALAGSFDEVADTVTVLLTPANIVTARAAIATHNAKVPQPSPLIMVPELAVGATFSAIGVVARRNLIRAVPDIDSASSTCTFTLAAVAPAVVPEVPTPALLALAAAAIGGAAVGVTRRRRRGAA